MNKSSGKFFYHFFFHILTKQNKKLNNVKILNPQLTSEGVYFSYQQLNFNLNWNDMWSYIMNEIPGKFYAISVW